MFYPLLDYLPCNTSFSQVQYNHYSWNDLLTPDTIVAINVGDTIDFGSLGGNHNAVEVDESTLE